MTHTSDINPLDVFKTRRVEYPPRHWANTVVIGNTQNRKRIKKWVEKKTKGRYAITETIIINDQKKYSNHYRIWFENSKELTLFLLSYQ